MNLLEFDSKLTKATTVYLASTSEEFRSTIGGGDVEAWLLGRSIHVFDEAVAVNLYELAGFGQWPDDDRLGTAPVNPRCFTTKLDEKTDGLEELEVQEAATSWADQTPVVKMLLLLPEEAAFLAFDWDILQMRQRKQSYSREDLWSKLCSIGGVDFIKNYAVFRHLKRNGWCVRRGQTFGCTYLIYRLGAKYFHASAAVLLCEEIDALQLISLTRITTNNRKALLLAYVAIPEGLDLNSPICLDKIEVKIVAAKTWFLDREVPKLAMLQNELYETSARSSLD
ncbi:unnamed protein product [Caenorhabditis auriculariae]|uniref:tRNA-intron lyase n=1 Tax=Caenorhabditis auriculariae TaxID=2777116 RepID=A0A8S1HV47_9PELO|nr:unnamed protein product [Caenorhabditis auriculariae]